MSGRKLVLVRHGETEWSRTGRHTGRTDIALTELGESQAEAVGAMLGGREFAGALVSPLRRAAETYRRSGLDVGGVQVLDDLVEWDYGEYEGLTTTEIRQRAPGWTLWAGPIPGGESPDDVGRRADRAIDAALAIDGNGDVAVFAHGHLLRVLAARWLDLEPSAGRHFALETATVSILGYERDTRVIAAWNEPCRV
jgi:broad specificity phosphatase PhoE